MSNIVVGISEYKTAMKPDILVSYALGSCMGIALYDDETGIGGLSHILLPDSRTASGGVERKRYANTATVDMIAEMRRQGAGVSGLSAKIIGGADMFGHGNGPAVHSIGDSNIMAVKRVLIELGIRIIAEDVGKDYGRTIRFNLEDGSVKVQSHGRSENIL